MKPPLSQPPSASKHYFRTVAVWSWVLWGGLLVLLTRVWRQISVRALKQLTFARLISQWRRTFCGDGSGWLKRRLTHWMCLIVFWLKRVEIAHDSVCRGRTCCRRERWFWRIGLEVWRLCNIFEILKMLPIYAINSSEGRRLRTVVEQRKCILFCFANWFPMVLSSVTWLKESANG